MKILFLGDVVGEPGRKILRKALPALKAQHSIDLVFANVENAASGSGLNPRCYQQLAVAGVQACTMGDHVYKKTEIYSLFDEGKPVCKPANFPFDSPGPEYLVIDAPDGTPVALFCLLGRIFMRPVDCPFRAADRILDQLAGKAKVVVVDIHAEATSEKQLMLRHLLGRVSAVVGTHTHVPTADASVHPPGTAYITDVGMTGPYDSVIGRRYDRVLQTTLTFEPTAFEVATGDPRVSGALIEVDPASGHAAAIELIHLDKNALDSLAACAPLET